MVSDGGAVFLSAIVIAGDRAAAEITAFPYISVAYISKMSHFGFPAQTAVFQLDKGTDLALRTHGAVGTQVGIRADLTARFHNTLLTLRGIDPHAVTHRTVREHTVRADLTVCSNHSPAPQDRAGQQHRTRAHANTRIHISIVGIHDADAAGKQFPQDLRPGQELHAVESLKRGNGRKARHAPGALHLFCTSFQAVRQYAAGSSVHFVLSGAVHRHGSARHHQSFLFALQKSQQIGAVVGYRHLFCRRKARQSLFLIRCRAAHKKALHTLFAQRSAQPSEHRAKQDVLQHQRFSDQFSLCVIHK